MTVRILVKGKVQGVFYRASTKAEAQKLGLSGFVRNLSDGNVEIEAQGSQESIEKLLKWCKGGPPAAIVEDVQTKAIEEKNYSEKFIIK